MNKAGERLYNGIIKENPTFVLMLGMCPTLAVTTSAMNGLGMGLTTAVVLTMSNLIISLLRKVIPSRVRIPAFIVIIASFVTAVQLLLQAYLPSLNDALGGVYSSDCCKLYHSGKSRELCVFPSAHSFPVRWTWHGTWFLSGTDLYRCST